MKKMMDFTLKTYANLLATAKGSRYSFLTFEQFALCDDRARTIVLRHDVDKLPENALKMAVLENAMGVRASYFFRVVPQTWKTEIIKEIVRLGHEVAYHYEDLTLFKGSYEKAIQHFERQLARFRELYPSRTICMHGSPMTQWDNRKLWERYDYRDYGIIAEPYFDVDYSRVFYITDTGRSWNKASVNRRDTVPSGFDISIRSTTHMMLLFKEGKMPEHVIINTHPQRWFDPGWGWIRELMMQNIKNVVKRVIVRNGQSLQQGTYAAGN